MARTSDKYDKALAARICEEIAHTTQSLKRICETNPGFPCVRTVRGWIAKNAEFQQAYLAAKQLQAELLAEEICDIADDGSNDYTVLPDGREVLNQEHVQRSRLRVDSRKWLLCHLLPSKFGDKSKVEHTGEGGGPVKFVLERIGASK